MDRYVIHSQYGYFKRLEPAGGGVTDSVRFVWVSRPEDATHFRTSDEGMIARPTREDGRPFGLVVIHKPVRR